MSDTTHLPALAPLPRPNPLSLLAGGRRAFAEVPGLRRYMAKGFALLYGVSIGVGLVGVGLVYAFVVQPLMGGVDAWSADGGWWAEVLGWLLGLVLWIAQLALMAATVVLSLIISVSMMSLWFEGLVDRIVSHQRGTAGEDAPFSLAAWTASIGRALKDAMWLILLSVLGLVLGFVPVIGPVLVVLVQGYLLGREVRDPYLEARERLGDPHKPLRKGLAFWTIIAGLLPFGLALVPIAGWLLLPAAIVYLVAGFAWRGEQAARPAADPSVA